MIAVKDYMVEEMYEVETCSMKFQFARNCEMFKLSWVNTNSLG